MILRTTAKHINPEYGYSLTQKISYTNNPPSKIQPVLILFNCRNSTPFKAKASPNRLLAIQC
jgi:hypothetical protein